MSDDKRICGLRAHASARTTAVVAKIQQAMKVISLDIEQNEGVYPFNAGRLSREEICRRAAIKSSILDGPAHRKTTLVMVNSWLKQTKENIAVGRKIVRKLVTKRADDWKQKSELLATQVHLYHLQMVTLQNKLQHANARIKELEETEIRLQALVSEGKVSRISRHKK